MKNNIKNEIKNNFSMIPNALILDNTISDRARFVYCLLSSKPDTWVFYNNALAKELQYTVDTLRKYMKELIDKGWIEKVSQPGGSNDYIIKHTNLEVVGKNTRGEKTHGFFSYPNKEVLEVKSTLEKEVQRESDESTKPAKFTKPTLQQIADYITENNFSIDAQVFLSHYESNGWMVGKTKMKSWQAALTGWNTRKFNDRGNHNGQHNNSVSSAEWDNANF